MLFIFHYVKSLNYSESINKYEFIELVVTSRVTSPRYKNLLVLD